MPPAHDYTSDTFCCATHFREMNFCLNLRGFAINHNLAKITTSAINLGKPIFVFVDADLEIGNQPALGRRASEEEPLCLWAFMHTEPP